MKHEEDGATALPYSFGRYTLLEEIGRGAMGVVYAAYDEGLDRRVAVKVLRASPLTDEASRRRFSAEAKAIARVRHPSIVEVYDHGSIDGHLFYAMSLVEGMSLDEAIRMNGARPLEPIARGGQQIAEALAALHAAGVVHRDLKPQNIMLDHDGRWVLADFGLARVAEAPTLTIKGQVLGTPLYMSPEQALGQRGQIDARSDVYGLGAALYHALAGRPPFEASELTALLGQVASDRPPPPSEHAEGVSRDADRVVLKCLEKRPSDRYASAEALASDLGALAEGEQVAGRPVSGTQQALRFLRKRWRGLSAAGVVLVTPLLVLLWFLNAPGVLVVTTVPGATISIDGGEPIHLPREIELPAGWYTIRIDAPGFRTHVGRVEIKAHSELKLGSLSLSLSASPSEADVQALSKVTRLASAALSADKKKKDSSRNTASTPFLAIAPRGTVTRRDMGWLAMDWSLEIPKEGRLVFRRGEETLYEEAFDPDAPAGPRPMPDAVLKALKPGDTLTWGLVRPNGERTLAKATLVDSTALESPEDRLKDQVDRLDRMTIAHLLVRALLHSGRASAALAHLEGLEGDDLDMEALAGLKRATLRALFSDHMEMLVRSEYWANANR